MAQWVQDRQKAFQHFQHNLIQPPLASRSWTPPPTTLLGNNNLQEELQDIPDRGIGRQDIPNKYQNRMLTNSETLNPKAKVSYDEGQFCVEIPLHEYKVSQCNLTVAQCYRIVNSRNFKKRILKE